MKKVLFILGTRPEGIKLSPLITAFKQSAILETKVCITAQHRELLDEVLDFFSIIPDYDLDIMKEAQTLGEITSKILTSVTKVVLENQPDLIIVQGDTTTAFAGALVAFYNKIKIAHIEAGLRSHNKFSPFPEEINRVYISKIADFHFAPTAITLENLKTEGINENAWNVGNTVIDALLFGLKILENDKIKLEKKYNYLQPNRRLILVTTHRRENFGEPLRGICNVLLKVTEEYPDVEIIFPVHPNPNVRTIVENLLKPNKNIHLIQPLPYAELIWLMKKSHLILTDSGGIQEEAPSLGKPVIVMREETERMEGVEVGTAILAGNRFQNIYHHLKSLLSDIALYNKMSNAINPYGDGHTSQRILKILEDVL